MFSALTACSVSYSAEYLHLGTFHGTAEQTDQGPAYQGASQQQGQRQHVLLRADTVEMRLLEMGKLSPAVHQGVPDRRDMRTQARLRHHVQQLEMQAVRTDGEEGTALDEDGPGLRALEAGGKSEGDDREDRGRHAGPASPDQQDLAGPPSAADRHVLIKGRTRQD